MKKEKTLAKHMNGNPIEMREMEYESLLQNVGNALSRGRQRVASYIGTQTVRTYWEIVLSGTLNDPSNIRLIGEA